MKFAFIVHPLSPATAAMVSLDRTGEFRKLWRHGSVLAISDHLQAWMAANANRRERSHDVAVIDELNDLYSINGTCTQGRLYEIPMTPMEIKDDPATAIAHMEEAISMATDWGAKIIGLGSMTGIVGGQGSYVAERSSIAVTTGNSLTVYAALENVHQVCRQLHLDLRNETVAVVGAPGSIASATARMLAPQVGQLILVSRRETSRAQKLASRLNAELMLDIPSALKRANVVLTATSTGSCVDQADLLPGSVVIDVGVPADVQGTSAQRDDVLIVSGGLVRVPETMSRDSLFLGFYYGVVPACLAETMNLALEERPESFSLGRQLEPAGIREIGRIARLNGFDFSTVFSFGQPVEDVVWARMIKATTRRKLQNKTHTQPAQEPRAANGSPKNGQDASPQASGKQRRNGKHPELQLDLPTTALPEASEMAAQAETLYGRYVNPVMAGIAKEAGLVATFVKGQGNHVWDVDGNKYLDFVAGFGSVNLGHNHPRVIAAIQEAITRQVPGFAPAAINPYAASLAERLVALSPPGLEVVFFCNSGTESVEAGLKLARSASGRSALLHCGGGFHGKTFGSLSVTGNAQYQKPFSPLLPNCEAVPYGDIDALEQALRSRQFAAFIVEPIQGEGGMIPAPPDYLKAAQELCRQTQTLLIVDEVQTGMGRTGALFACDHYGIEPDIMCLAKSLGGGAVPIGAMLASRELWKKAYGTLETFALHTSTFGGGSMACAAALATLDVLVEDRLAENAWARGEQLCEGLLKIQADLPHYIKQVRGQGLMIGVELTPLAPIVAKHLKRTDLTGLLQYLVQGLDELTNTLPAVFQMQMLFQHSRIFTQVARSNPYVLRIQPPLTITEREVDQFLESFAKTCRAGQDIEDLFDVVISKAVAGHHEGSQPVDAGRAATVAMQGSHGESRTFDFSGDA